VSELSIKIALLFLPGFLAYAIVDKLTFHQKHETYHMLLYSYILGLISYFLYYLVTIGFNFFGHQLDFVFAKSISEGKWHLSFAEILWVSGISIGVAIGAVKFINSGCLYKPFLKCKFTKKCSSDDAWLSSMHKGWNPYVEIEDLKNQVIYIGWIENFSEYAQHREVLLRDVVIKKPDSIEKTPAIYLTLQEDVTLKFLLAPYYEEPDLERRKSNGKRKKTVTAAAKQTDTTTAAATARATGSST
jgi:hypothetical protein